MAEILIEQVRSANGASPKQRDTLRSLRLGRIGKTSLREDTDAVRAMLSKVEHMVSVKDGKAKS